MGLELDYRGLLLFGLPPLASTLSPTNQHIFISSRVAARVLESLKIVLLGLAGKKFEDAAWTELTYSPCNTKLPITQPFHYAVAPSLSAPSPTRMLALLVAISEAGRNERTERTERTERVAEPQGDFISHLRQAEGGGPSNTDARREWQQVLHGDDLVITQRSGHGYKPPLLCGARVLATVTHVHSNSVSTACMRENTLLHTTNDH